MPAHKQPTLPSMHWPKLTSTQTRHGQKGTSPLCGTSHSAGNKQGSKQPTWLRAPQARTPCHAAAAGSGCVLHSSLPHAPAGTLGRPFPSMCRATGRAALLSPLRHKTGRCGVGAGRRPLLPLLLLLPAPAHVPNCCCSSSPGCANGQLHQSCGRALVHCFTCKQAGRAGGCVVLWERGWAGILLCGRACVDLQKRGGLRVCVRPIVQLCATAIGGAGV